MAITMKLLPASIMGLVLACSLQGALAADPGEAWFTDTAGSGVPPDGVRWLAPGSACPVLKAKLSQAVQALASESDVALTAKTLPLYAAPSCKGKYGQFPFLVRAVSTAGEGHLDTGLLGGEVWMRFAGVGGRYPFEKTPVVLWLYAPPARVHVSASIVE
jgi:hypothetical protein